MHVAVWSFFLGVTSRSLQLSIMRCAALSVSWSTRAELASWFVQDKANAMIKHLASLSQDRLIISFAPKTLAYTVLKRIGELFPGPSKVRSHAKTAGDNIAPLFHLYFLLFQLSGVTHGCAAVSLERQKNLCLQGAAYTTMFVLTAAAHSKICQQHAFRRE